MKKDLKELIENRLTISERQFAKVIGLSRQTLFNIMHGKHEPSVLTVKTICKYFGEDYKDYI